MMDTMTDPFAGVPVAKIDRTSRPADLATDKQVSFIATLREERGQEADREGAAKLSKREASAEIDRLMKLPRAPREAHTREPVAEVPAGRYALDTRDGGVAFYQVDRPTEGRWSGYTFVKLLIGAPGDWRKERVGNWSSIVARIAEAGPREAAIRFGMESGHCGRCGSPLSNEESRRLGIGPVCRDKAGW